MTPVMIETDEIDQVNVSVQHALNNKFAHYTCGASELYNDQDTDCSVEGIISNIKEWIRASIAKINRLFLYDGVFDVPVVVDERLAGQRYRVSPTSEATFGKIVRDITGNHHYAARSSSFAINGHTEELELDASFRTSSGFGISIKQSIVICHGRAIYFETSCDTCFDPMRIPDNVGIKWDMFDMIGSIRAVSYDHNLKRAIRKLSMHAQRLESAFFLAILQ